MQDSFDSTPEEADVDAQKMSTSQHNLLVTPEVTTPNLKMTWDSSWNYSAVKNEWTNNSEENHNFPKPMIASAPITPTVIPYHGLYNNSYLLKIKCGNQNYFYGITTVSN